MTTDPVRTRTRTDSRERRRAKQRVSEPLLVILFQAGRPLDTPARRRLSSLDEVLVGRGAERGSTSVTRDGVRRLTLRFVDPWMSATHARFVRQGEGWRVEDAAAKNGVLVNGAPVASATLKNGDLLELGHTFFLYRQAVDLPVDEPDDYDPYRRAPAASVFATLLPDLRDRFSELARVAATNVTVLVRGETGTGKEGVARAVHELSGRQGPFVPVNTGAILEGLLESEIFGHKKGAFTGAVDDRRGLVRAAHGGTLFLDEIGDLPLPAQAALLRVLQERQVTPVGGDGRSIGVDLRVVSATHRDLEAMIAAGTFRQDLYGRLRGFELCLPPLRERREDLGLLVGALLCRLAPGRRDDITFKSEATRALLRYHYPQNIRELEKILEVAIPLAGDAPIDLEHLQGPVARALDAAPAEPAGRDGLPATLVVLLRKHGGNVAAVARELGKDGRQVRRWLAQFQIRAAAYRK
jgi:transcriptional regulator with AAA-type ATPase domain